jgi:hypothetical protein
MPGGDEILFEVAKRERERLEKRERMRENIRGGGREMPNLDLAYPSSESSVRRSCAACGSPIFGRRIW